MRKSILILALLISGTTYTSYSQKLSEPLLKEINLRIAEGIECKQLLEEKSNQVAILQNLSKEQTAKAENLNKQVILLTENNTISEGRTEAALIAVDKCSADKAKAVSDVERLKKGRRTWRLIAGIETVLLVGIVYLSTR
jgi:hypothetical protein